MTDWAIPLADLDLGEAEVEAVSAVIRSRWLTQGERVREFETRFAEMTGAKHAFAVANCTAALHLAYASLDPAPGDEILMPALTFVATANAAVAIGAVPVFAEVESAADLTVSPGDLEKRITPRTRAIAVVHYSGFSCRMEAILALASRHELAVIEDCAHAPGAWLGGKHLGTFGDVGCFSFFSNKNMTTGEGGMIVTERDDLAERIRLMRSHGMTTLTWDRHRGHAPTYDVLLAGHNFRLDEIRAALGIVQLEKLAANNARRRVLVGIYRKLLAGIVEVPFMGRDDGAFHLMVVLLPAGTERSAVAAALRDARIQTSVHYPPVHSFTYYQQRGKVSLPLTEGIAARLLTLPLYPGMTEDQVLTVVHALAAALSPVAAS